MFFDKNKSIFKQTIKLGEEILGLSFSDYNDAYSFSEAQYSGTSKHAIEFFTQYGNEPQGTYETDLIRYQYIKAIEHRISSDIYANTDRGNVCDILRSPFDIHLPVYPVNLPKHLEDIVNSFQDDARRLANAVVSKILPMCGNVISYPILNAVQFLGQAFGYHVGQENLFYMGYRCSDMITRDEISALACADLCESLEEDGFKILGTSLTREPILSILATKDGQRLLVGFAAEIAPTEPVFIQKDLDELYAAAQRIHAKPKCEYVQLGSKNPQHFQDGVIISMDETIYRTMAADSREGD